MFVTIREVAQEAGVSIATASRALSGRRPVLEAHQRAVLEASDRLGYRANTAARSLRTRTTGTVGMVVPRISNPYFPLLVEAVERQLSATGRELLLCDSQNDIGIEAARVTALLDRRVDGLLFIGCHRRASAAIVKKAQAQVPVVEMDRYVDGEEVDFVGVDHEAGIVAVIEHLRDTGRRTSVFVSSETVDSSALLRLRAYRKTMRKVDAESARHVLLGDYSLEWGRQAVESLIEEGPLPDSIICGNDIIALGVIAALREARLAVPTDVAVTGFDDIPFAAISTPPLTTLRQPADEIGAEAVQMLQRRLEGSDEQPAHVTLRPELLVRGSTVAQAQPRQASSTTRC
jgi:LacI family transcriptional regulator